MSNDNETEATQEESLTDTLGGSDEFFVDGEKKASARPQALIGLLLTVVAAGGYFFYFKPAPAAATAATTATPSVAARKTIDEFLTSGSKDIVAMEQMLKNTESVVKQFLAYPSMTQVPLADLRTNPFRYAPPEKRENSDTENRRIKEEARNRALRAVSELRVDSLMSSAAGGTAIINGKFVRPGDVVEGFTVESIKQGGVVVRDDTFRFELRISK